MDGGSPSKPLACAIIAFIIIAWMAFYSMYIRLVVKHYLRSYQVLPLGFSLSQYPRHNKAFVGKATRFSFHFLIAGLLLSESEVLVLVVFCCMAISCFSTGDYTTDTGPDPSREGTTVCAHPNDGHIYLVGNKTCYIVLPASHFEHLCPMGYQCRGAGDSSCRMPLSKPRFMCFLFSFLGQIILYS